MSPEIVQRPRLVKRPASFSRGPSEAKKKKNTERHDAEARQAQDESTQIRRIEGMIAASGRSATSPEMVEGSRNALEPNILGLVSTVAAALIAHEKFKMTGEPANAPMGGGVALQQLENEYLTQSPENQALIRNELSRLLALSGVAAIMIRDTNGRLNFTRE